MTISRRNLLRAGLAAPAVLALPRAVIAQETPAASQARSQSFRVGDIEIIALSDGYLELPVAMMVGYEPDAAADAAEAAYRRHNGETMHLGVNGYIIRAGGQVIAVDGGTPDVVAPTAGAWRASLAQADILPEDITIAFQTHLHMDHVGGLGALGANARGLPNATLVVSQADWDFTHSDAVFAQSPEMLQASMQMAQALVAPYAADAQRIAMAETEIAPGVTAVPLPGHTPGHMGLRLNSGNETLLIWADALHAQAFQFMHPEWSLALDADMDQARQTRARLLDELATDRVRVAGSHLDFPSLGYVERAGTAYRYVPGGADYS